jgi:hypothetical protein
MFLPDIENHKPTERNKFSDAIAASERAGDHVAGIWRLFAWKPALAEPLGKVAQEIVRGPSAHSPGFREMIAAFVSTRNHCLF